MSLDTQRVDFDISQFKQLIKEKGFNVLHQKSMICSCFNENHEINPTCIYCNGTGWRYLDAVKIKGIITGIQNEKNLLIQGIDNLGIAFITAMPEVHLSYRDRITLTDAIMIDSEFIQDSVQLQKLRNPIINIENVSYLGTEYTEDTDFTIIDSKLNWLDSDDFPTKYSVRYTTNPSWLILDFPNIVRGTIAQVKSPIIQYVSLPVRAKMKLEMRIRDEDFV